MEFAHYSVLLDESIENLKIRPDGVYADGTVGGGGHSEQIAKRLTTGKLICSDADTEALEAAKKRLAPYGSNIEFLHGNFEDLPAQMDRLSLPYADGILLDLGVSSYQLDNRERGFSYSEDAPLDMRMDQSAPLTAAVVVNTYDEAELVRILREYGEERFAGAIARRIVAARREKPLETTGELVEIIRQAIPARARREGGHPAKRTFQALRIEVNHELDALKGALPALIDRLAPGGRFCVITFHSLEDRIVKEAFRTAADPCICPKSFPVCVCGRKSKGQVITRKPILPSEEELAENKRSKSAKLRVFEHI